LPVVCQKGVALDRATGCLSGTPQRAQLCRLPASASSWLKPGLVGKELHAALAEFGQRVDEPARVIAGDTPDTWILSDANGRRLLRSEADGVRVLRGDDHYAITLSVHDASYEVGDDIRPWIIPFLATALSLIGFWNMRRWGVILLAVLWVAQVGLLATQAAPIAVTGLVLEGVILLIGMVHFRQMV
jgi:hypothetical protein